MPSSPFFSVQQGKTTSTGSSRTRRFLKCHKALHAAARAKGHGDIFSLQASHSPVHSPSVGPGYKCQLPSFFNAHGQHVEFFFVQVVQHAGGAHARNLMLAGNAAKQDGNGCFCQYRHTFASFLRAAPLRLCCKQARTLLAFIIP